MSKFTLLFRYGIRTFNFILLNHEDAAIKLEAKYFYHILIGFCPNLVICYLTLEAA